MGTMSQKEMLEYQAKIKGRLQAIWKDIESLSGELEIADSPEGRELKDVYTRFTARAFNVAPVLYLKK